MTRWRPALAVAAVVLALLLFVVLATGGDAGALAAFWRGSLGTKSALLSGTLVRAIPLALIGTGLAIAFRAGVLNIGAEGQLLMGAVAGTIVGLHASASGAILLALAAGALAGSAWAAIAGWLRVRFGVLEIISTIMLNFVAANLVSYLVRGPLQEPTRVYPQTIEIHAAAQLPRLGDMRLHAGIVIAALACVLAWWLFARTAAGFRMRVVGASPDAARVSGRVAVARTTLGAMALSGGLAGLAGGIEVTGVTYALYENISPGYGFAGIAVAMLARLDPRWVAPSALLFATLETGALGLQRDAGLPSTFAAVLEAVAILAVIAMHGWLRMGERPSAVAASQPA